jgi:hypothetical protein
MTEAMTSPEVGQRIDNDYLVLRWMLLNQSSLYRASEMLTAHQLHALRSVEPLLSHHIKAKVYGGMCEAD